MLQTRPTILLDTYFALAGLTIMYSSASYPVLSIYMLEPTSLDWTMCSKTLHSQTRTACLKHGFEIVHLAGVWRASGTMF